MATGPEHYREAERLITLAESLDWTTEVEPYLSPALAAAQVHATLALVAATVEIAAARGPGDVTREWIDIVWPVTT